MSCVSHSLLWESEEVVQESKAPLLQQSAWSTDQKEGCSWSADYHVIYQLIIMWSISWPTVTFQNWSAVISYCPHKCLISADLRRRGKKESDQGPSDEVFCDQPTNHPSHLYSSLWTLPTHPTPLFSGGLKFTVRDEQLLSEIQKYWSKLISSLSPTEVFWGGMSFENCLIP